MFSPKKKKKSPTPPSPPKNLITFAIFGLEMIFETEMAKVITFFGGEGGLGGLFFFFLGENTFHL